MVDRQDKQKEQMKYSSALECLIRLSSPKQYDNTPYMHEEYYYDHYDDEGESFDSEEEEVQEEFNEFEVPEELLQLKKSDTLVCVDIQEVAGFDFGLNMSDLALFMTLYPSVIYVLDEIMSPEGLPQVPIDLMPYFTRASNYTIYTKEYNSFLRIANDFGLEEECLAFFQDEAKGIPFETLLKKHSHFLEEMRSEYGRDSLERMAEELIKSRGELVTGLDKSFFDECRGGIDICGGHRNECLKEVTSALQIHGISFNLIGAFIYD